MPSKKDFYKKKYKEKLAQYLGVSPKQIGLFAKGRVGLFGILKALNIQEGDEVIIPAFTCVVVPNAIIYLKGKPVYVDIDAKTFNMDVNKVEAAITPKTKFIIAQNTFGLASDNDVLQEICTRHNLYLLEDCTHGFGGTYKGKQNGTISDAAFYSTQWNKTFSTGFGGISVSQNKSLAYSLSQFEESLTRPSFSEILSIEAQLFARTHLLSPKIYWSAIKFYRFLSKTGIVSGSSSGLELNKPEMPNDYLKSFTEAQSKKGIVELEYLEENLKHRKKIAAIYKRGFLEMGFSPIFEPAYAEHTFILFPFFVKDRPSFQKKAALNKIPLNDWLNSPIHPIQEGFEKWQYTYGCAPIAEKISKHILNLPTDKSVREKDAKLYINYLIANKNDLFKI